MISRDNKFIFIQPPKNATTSIRSWLMDRDLVDPLPWRRHSPAKVLFEAIEPDIWHSAFKFTVIRNPYDRAVSMYLYLQKISTNPGMAIQDDPHTLWAKEVMLGCSSFKDFIVLSRTDASLYNYLKATTQSKFINKPNFTCARFENLEIDFKTKICNGIGIDYDIPLPMYNASIGRLRWEDVVCSYTISIINRIYKQDFKKFNYNMIKP